MDDMNDMNIIDIYSRTDAIEDGTLIDVTETAKEFFTIAVAVTSTVWVGVIEPDTIAKTNGESTESRLRQVLLTVLRAVMHTPNTFEIPFEISVREEGKEEKVSLKGIVGEGDDIEPVITIMYINED